MAGQHTLYLHIGLPKTASTYLQSSLFPRLTHLTYRDTPRSRLFDTDEDRARGHRLLPAFIGRATGIWQAAGARLFAELLGGDRPADRSLLISDEGIGRFGSRPSTLAAHLHALRPAAADAGFGRIALLCLIRRQDRWLASHYAQMSDRLDRPGQAGFEAEAARIADPFAGRYGLGAMLDYDRLYAMLEAAVGADNLLMLPQEALSDAPDRSVDTMLRFLGATPDSLADQAGGQRANARALGRDRWRLRPPRPAGLRHRLLSRWGRRTPDEIVLTDAVSRQILDSYRAGNQALSPRLPIPLAPYGYC